MAAGETWLVPEDGPLVLDLEAPPRLLPFELEGVSIEQLMNAGRTAGANAHRLQVMLPGATPAPGREE